jgi:multidrug efflux pump subunit AcrA (membrane-fusion protein)
VLRAPYAGTVTAIFAEPGEYRATGQPILELSGAGEVEVQLAVPEIIAFGLVPEARVAVRRSAGSERSTFGHIQAIGGAGGGAHALFPVLVFLEGGILAGTSVEVALRPDTFRPEAPTSVVLPIDAVVDPSGRQPVVYRLREADGAARVERIEVSIGALVEGLVTVLGNVAAGDRVVVAGQRGLLHDDFVEIVP